MFGSECLQGAVWELEDDAVHEIDVDDSAGKFFTLILEADGLSAGGTEVSPGALQVIIFLGANSMVMVIEPFQQRPCQRRPLKNIAKN